MWKGHQEIASQPVFLDFFSSKMCLPTSHLTYPMGLLYAPQITPHPNKRGAQKLPVGRAECSPDYLTSSTLGLLKSSGLPPFLSYLIPHLHPDVWKGSPFELERIPDSSIFLGSASNASRDSTPCNLPGPTSHTVWTLVHSQVSQPTPTQQGNSRHFHRMRPGN